MQRQRFFKRLSLLVLFCALWTTTHACNAPPAQQHTETSAPKSQPAPTKNAAPSQPPNPTPTENTGETAHPQNADKTNAAPKTPSFAAHTDAQQALLDKGTQALDQGDSTTAMLAFEALHRSQPFSGLKASGTLVLADLYLQKNRPKDAINILTELRKDAPPTSEISFVLGQAYKKDGQSRHALTSFQEAVSINPMLLHANIEIGGLLHELGETEKSAEVFLNYERSIYKHAKLLEAENTPPAQKFKIIEAFSFIPDDRIAQSLVDALDDKTRLIRLAAAEALGEVGIQNSIPELEDAIKEAKSNSDSTLVRMAQQSIERIRANPSETHSDRANQVGVGPTFVDPAKPDSNTTKPANKEPEPTKALRRPSPQEKPTP